VRDQTSIINTTLPLTESDRIHPGRTLLSKQTSSAPTPTPSATDK
jgi:hypothetical protein